MKKYILLPLLFILTLGVCAADKLAVAEPVNMGGATPDELNGFWSMLEANACGDGQYDLITRSSLQSMLTEIGLTETSNLVDLNSSQKAKLGELKTVKYILVSRLGRSGNRYTVVLMLLDASTGEIQAGRKISETYHSFAEISDKLKNTLRKIGIGSAPRIYGRSAVLTPIFCGPQVMPPYLAEELSVNLEYALTENKINIQNMKSVNAILQKNGISNLAEAEPALYSRIGDLLEVDYLIQVFVTRCSIRTEKKYIEVTRSNAIRHLGDINGSIRIISAQTGDVIKSAPFALKVDFDDIEDDTTDWTEEDFGRYLVRGVLPTLCSCAVLTIKQQQK